MTVKPVCKNCGLFFKPEKNGQMFEEGKPYNDGSPVRYWSENRKAWTSYKLWQGDLWKCGGCGAEIIIGVCSPVPISEHYKPNYEEIRASYGGDSIPFVHDC